MRSVIYSPQVSSSLLRDQDDITQQQKDLANCMSVAGEQEQTLRRRNERNRELEQI